MLLQMLLEAETARTNAHVPQEADETAFPFSVAASGRANGSRGAALAAAGKKRGGGGGGGASGAQASSGGDDVDNDGDGSSGNNNNGGNSKSSGEEDGEEQDEDDDDDRGAADDGSGSGGSDPEWMRVGEMSEEELAQRRHARAMRFFSKTVPLDVPLPPELQARIDEVLREGAFVAPAAGRHRDGRTFTREEATEELKRSNKLMYYLSHRMPPAYSVLRRVFLEMRMRLPAFEPRTVLDFGAATGTALWAARDVYFKQLAVGR